MILSKLHICKKGLIKVFAFTNRGVLIKSRLYFSVKSFHKPSTIAIANSSDPRSKIYVVIHKLYIIYVAHVGRYFTLLRVSNRKKLIKIICSLFLLKQGVTNVEC